MDKDGDEGKSLEWILSVCIHNQEGEKQGTRNKEQGTRNKEQGTRNKEQGTRNKEQGTRNKEQGTRTEKLRAIHMDNRTY